MAPKSKKQRRTRQVRTRDQLSSEPPRSVATTVAWVMATLATGAAMFFSTLTYALQGPVQNPADAGNTFAALSGALHFVGLVTGALTLGLIPVVYRVRPIPPPLLVTVISASIGFSPWLLLMLRAYL